MPLLSPDFPFFGRIPSVLFCRHSLYRTLEYQVLARQVFKGRLLDVGGYAGASYLHLLRQNGVNLAYESLNVEEALKPDHVQDLNEGISLPNETYDTLISLNTLEHVNHVERCLPDLYRVLKTGGQAIIGVPFLFNVHGSPHDYNRHTPQWWMDRLHMAGFAEDKIEIIPIIWGPVTTGFSLIENWLASFQGRIPAWLLRGIRVMMRGLCLPMDALITRLAHRADENGRVPRAYGTTVLANFAHGWVIRAQK